MVYTQGRQVMAEWIQLSYSFLWSQVQIQQAILRIFSVILYMLLKMGGWAVCLGLVGGPNNFVCVICPSFNSLALTSFQQIIYKRMKK